MVYACGNDYAPKPRGYFKIDLPEKAYQAYSGECPFEFDYPVYSKVVPDSMGGSKACSPNLLFPKFNGRIHLSYYEVANRERLNELVEDAYKLAYKHVAKSTGIDRQEINYPSKNVYGALYHIEGNTASSVQFYLTDSSRHYIRGALYFREEPRLDSIQPVLDFVKKDIDVMIRSFRWKAN
ncbi:gliding motility lipoprotein GldD [Pedobacter sp. HMF7056]|uniref:Gliding motility lipoprotein GldD n=2 Tax=Hufsiella ginkgonis TaxID=2695274 RepID=A0A7K1XV93_9SPHI|nr:gliding motility lipoprotein GldD [Hufsiella ginkgonis]